MRPGKKLLKIDLILTDHVKLLEKVNPKCLWLPTNVRVTLLNIIGGYVFFLYEHVISLVLCYWAKLQQPLIGPLLNTIKIFINYLRVSI
jgi:hypothetical protein